MRGRWMQFLCFALFLAFFFFATRTLMAETAAAAASSEEDAARSEKYLKSFLQDPGAAAAAAEEEEEEGERRQQRRRRSTMGMGSRPPRCGAKRCGGCNPCRPVHVAVPPAATAEYYPEAWWCVCGGRLFLP